MRALKYHGGVALADLEAENVGAVREGMANLYQHVENLQTVFGQNVLVAINAFATDTAAEHEAISEALVPLGVEAVVTRHFAEGGAGAEDLARAVLARLDEPSNLTFAYEDDASLVEKAEAIATKVYRAEKVTWTVAAAKEVARLQESYGHLPVCIAKTQYSFATEKILGAPRGHSIAIREVRLNAGAGFVVLIAGSIMTMPGLPKRPAAADIDVVDGRILGIS